MHGADVAGNGPHRCCPTRHRMPFDKRVEVDDVAGNIWQAPPQSELPQRGCRCLRLDDRAPGTYIRPLFGLT